MNEADLRRFWGRVKREESGCWVWERPMRVGYGSLWYRECGRKWMKYAHRLAYEHFVGPIGVGLTIDHLCRNRACVNPEHLEVVTFAENVRRGLWRERCKRGHEYRMMPSGKKYCAWCASESSFRSRSKRKPGMRRMPTKYGTGGER